jgi:hypothetical protein
MAKRKLSKVRGNMTTSSGNTERNRGKRRRKSDGDMEIRYEDRK